MSAAQLFTRNRRLAYLIAAGFFFPGGDRQDVEQEALIGLWVAARDYDPAKGVPFKNWASIVIARQLRTCVSAANRGKHAPLNEAFTTVVFEGEILDILETIPHLHQVVDIAEDREQLRLTLERIDRDLSAWERRCVIGVAVGLSYPEIGGYKAVDNGLQRARRKLRAAA